MVSISDISKKAMDYSTQRQGVIARNIQRVNMPNQKAYDLAPFKGSFGSYLQMVTTSSGHLHGKNATAGNFKLEKSHDTYETSINGNNINIVEQTLKSSNAALDHKIATDIFSKFNKLQQMAIK